MSPRMKVSSPNYYNFKNLQYWLKLLDTLPREHISKTFLDNFDRCLEYESVSYTMVYAPCLEEVYLDIRNYSGYLCATSFLKAGHNCNTDRNSGEATRKRVERGSENIFFFKCPIERINSIPTACSIDRSN